MYKRTLKTFISLIIFLICETAFAYPVTFRDTTGRKISIPKRPSRVVCLVPSVTEMVFRIGGGDAVKGVTYHCTYPPEAALKPVVGGFYSPSIGRIASIHPDLIFASRAQKAVIKRFRNTCKVIILEANSIAEIEKHIGIIGDIFDRREKAQALIQKMGNNLALIRKKIAQIPKSKRKRVMRLMGRNRVMAPGDNSFQNEYIRLAGGIPPVFGKKGVIVTVSEEAWRRFNPQVIYACGGDRKVIRRILSRPGWRDVEAVRKRAIYFFPCDLTCRASTHAVYFISWLSSEIYGNIYAEKGAQVLSDGIVRSKLVALSLPYIDKASIVYSHIADFMNKTLIINFKHPLKVLLTLEGLRKGITTVGNHYLPPQLWGISHQMGFRNFRERIYDALRLRETDASLLMTGADMDNLSIQIKRFKAITVAALVTAGVRSNAVRMSKDEGRYYEPDPGTINIILMTNCRLTPRAMARAIIAATEAKTAALQDLDIRSAYTGRVHQATGTGTDNIIVVEGDGIRIDNAGGHSKMGELMAKAVYSGVREAIFKQNGIVRQRNVFQRLKERGISTYDLIPDDGLSPFMPKMKAVKALEALLLEPKYAAFIETALAASDQAEIGLIKNLKPFMRWCRMVAAEISGVEARPFKDLVGNKKLPMALKMAFNGLLNGIIWKQER